MNAEERLEWAAEHLAREITGHQDLADIPRSTIVAVTNVVISTLASRMLWRLVLDAKASLHLVRDEPMSAPAKEG